MRLGAPADVVQNMSARQSGDVINFNIYTKGKYHCGLWPLAALSVLIGGHSSEVSVSVQPQSVCVCISKQNKKNSNILYSLCIMILFLVFITILGERVGCLTVISLHMYFLYIHEWVSMIL